MGQALRLTWVVCSSPCHVNGKVHQDWLCSLEMNAADRAWLAGGTWRNNKQIETINGTCILSGEGFSLTRRRLGGAHDAITVLQTHRASLTVHLQATMGATGWSRQKWLVHCV